jgi:hypothetical protein
VSEVVPGYDTFSSGIQHAWEYGDKLTILPGGCIGKSPECSSHAARASASAEEMQLCVIKHSAV